MKKRTIKLADLKETFFVRTGLNEGHKDHLKELARSGVELPPLLVNEETLEVVGGRHRRAAYTELGVIEVECHMRKFRDRTEMIIEALKDNIGGSLPPTQGDVYQTIRILLADGVKRKDIIANLTETTGFPAKLVQQYLDRVQGDLAKARLKKAISAVVSGGKTVNEAAEEHDVEVATLKRNLSKEDKSTEATDVRKLKSWFSTKFVTLARSNATNLSKVMRDLKDGVLTKDQAIEIMSHIGMCLGRINHAHEGWVKRFEAETGMQVALEKSGREQGKRKKKKGQSTLEKMGLATTEAA